MKPVAGLWRRRLRIASGAWIARKAPDALVDGMTLLMFRLRQIPNAILPSYEIADMAKQGREVRLFSKRHEWYWRNDPRFSQTLDPKRIKLAFANKVALKRWQRELNAIINEGAANPSMGSIDDGQEGAREPRAAP
jgi:hypothetical protein